VAGLVTAALGVVLLLIAPSGAGLVIAGVPLLLGRGISDLATWRRWSTAWRGGVLVALGVTVVA
jgi:hypothetical protein